MLPGMWGAPLKGLSGYMPPIQSQDFVLGAYTGPTTSQAYTGTSTMTSSGDTKKYADFLAPLPYGIDGYYHYGQAMEAAVKADKPLFIDFTGHGCVTAAKWNSGYGRTRRYKSCSATNSSWYRSTATIRRMSRKKTG